MCIAVCPNERFAFRKGQEACHESASPSANIETFRDDAFPALGLAAFGPGRIGMSNPWTALSLPLPSFRRQRPTQRSGSLSGVWPTMPRPVVPGALLEDLKAGRNDACLGYPERPCEIQA